MWVAIEMLRATRRRRPARSISISVRLVSSNSSASSRMSALSSYLEDLSAGWRAMVLIRNFLSGDGEVRQALVLGLDADFGGKTGYREPVALDAEAGEAGKGGHGGEGMMPKAFAGVNVGDVDFHRRNVHALDRVVQR